MVVVAVGVVDAVGVVLVAGSEGETPACGMAQRLLSMIEFDPYCSRGPNVKLLYHFERI